MRSEERDWQIYHILAEKSAITLDELCMMAGTEESVAEESLERLERYRLISRKDDAWVIKSLHEILLTAELERIMKDSPMYMENGVIKVRTEGEEK
ncbi:hypothetical protein L1S32_01960 [Methanogenium sp. S4BF]|uniref:hypothetical protein n=1 Tax=Methanogenium sp. S4BF TaxID=1789226 RepID=UPI002415BD83|nr:hypothetical protein [Methanogenium sp. S4BF]WFN34907.1 hypothetical protein L1S32_01960 [Methanogenium sp. S4BF]